MRACARVALVLMALSTIFGLAGCAAIDELRDTILRWVQSEKLPSALSSLVTRSTRKLRVMQPQESVC